MCRKGRKNLVYMYCKNNENFIIAVVLYVERVETMYFTCIPAVRTLAAGHKMIAEGWQLFDEAVEDAGAGDLPQLLRSIKGMTTPQPTMPPPMDDSARTPAPSPSPVKREPGNEDPIMIRVEGKIKYSCPQCDKVITSKNGCDAHIRQVHSGKALVCSFCRFSTYNLDSLNRHAREHK